LKCSALRLAQLFLPCTAGRRLICTTSAQALTLGLAGASSGAGAGVTIITALKRLFPVTL
jgi:hypothetical protein